MKKITELLMSKGDDKFADFQAKLIPTVDRKSIIGVRTPVLRSLAKELLADEEFVYGEMPKFLNELPHAYFDENALHGELISKEKDFEKAIRLVEDFLPYIDNWAVCDLLDPKVFKKHKEELLEIIKKWLKSDSVYTVRFGIDMMIKHFLDECFDVSHLALVEAACGDDYYIKMAQAWYYSFALIKHYDETLAYLKGSSLDRWTLKKSVQKARESYRIDETRKTDLKEFSKHV